jgi:hypothetical protein
MSQIEQPSMAGPKKNGAVIAVLIIVVLFALCTILALRGGRPTWGDETFTVRLATESWGEFWQDIHSDVHPPLYFALSKLVAGLSGGSSPAPISIRFLAYLLHLALICLTLRLLYRRVADHAAVWMSAAVLVSSAHLALFGPMLRYYALSGIGAVCGTLLLLPESNGENETRRSRTRRAFWYAVALLVAFASSYITAVILPAHLIYLMKDPERRKLPLRVALGVSMLLSLPLIRLLADQVSMRGLPSPAGLGALVMGFVGRLIFSIYSFSFGEFIRPWTWIIIPAILCVVWLIVLAWKLRKTEPGGLLWLTFLTALPLGVAALTRANVGLEFSASRLLFLPPIFLVLLGMAPAAYPAGSWRRKTGIAAICVLIAINLLSTWHFHNRTDYVQSTYVIPWAEIGRDVGSAVTTNAVILYDDDTLLYWLSAGVQPVRKINVNSLAVDQGQAARAQFEDYNSVIVVYSPRDITAQGLMDLTLLEIERSYSLSMEKPYLIEDETSLRWKSMLLGRTVEPVKKVLRVYVRR